MDELTADLHKRSGIPKHVETMIRSFPKDMHAMSMFGAALFAMQVGGVVYEDTGRTMSTGVVLCCMFVLLRLQEGGYDRRANYRYDDP